MNGVLLILRLALALCLIAGGTTKLSGYLRRQASAEPVLALGIIELGAGVLVGLGLFTPLAGLLLVAATANLAFVAWPHEYPLYLLFAAVAVALAGSGGYSLDHAVLGSSADGSGSLGVAVGLAGAVMMEGRRQLRRYRAAPQAALRVHTDEVPEGAANAG
ncbi:MAG: putative oxidoreductase [Solirubrobacteraceae bacterium]|jgi:uncharacterized membrane protein YphA (DoxX/SURF4 family)|nr:putative oxidoreductase [Solirubrobacteraceae bacterium]